MPVSERRRAEKETSHSLKRQLNADQQMALIELERFGWELKFIRHKPFQPAAAVVFDGDRQCFAVLREDGTLDEDHPHFQLRA